MLAYDAKKVPPAFGLENTGAICYFNCLLQALASCSSLVATALERGEHMRKTRTGAAILEFLRAALGPDPLTDSTRSHSSRILAAMRADLAERTPSIIFGRGQESASEALVLLLEIMEAPPATSSVKTDSPLARLFTGRYRCQTYCRDCRSLVASNEDLTVCFDLFHQTPVAKRPRTPAEFVRSLQHHISQGDADFVCRHCAKRVVTTRVYDLLMIPEILVLQFNRYDSHGTRDSLYFPDQFAISSKVPGRALSYRLVAQVEHSGTLSGGHYWARALRAGGGVWCLNDTSVTPAKFSPSGETYLLFYHYTGTGADAPGEPGPHASAAPDSFPMPARPAGNREPGIWSAGTSGVGSTPPGGAAEAAALPPPPGTFAPPPPACSLSAVSY